MQILITFLEGILAFLSPCLLPLFPAYVSFLAGGTEGKGRAFLRTLFFVFGFTAVFCAMGLLAGTLGRFLTAYAVLVRAVCGAVVILFGLVYLGIIPLPYLRGVENRVEVRSLFSAFLFGVVYSVSVMPCVGVFLGSALLLASTSATAFRGVLLLVVYSIGMGVPFLLSSVLLETLLTAFDVVKRHYRAVKWLCGFFLIAVGILMMTGLLGKWMALLQ